ncbi:MAG: HAMP domain-containing histidine kinase, partial [Synergistaceae bacterium]|nr:HAMP domain-containing histidine kinase [Synergistaceae bacterium]
RITVIGPDGTVIADSSLTPAETGELDNHAGRPEVRDAMYGGSGMDRRYSETTREPYLYYAIATDSGYIVRCSFPLVRFYRMMSSARANIFMSLLVAGGCALFAGLIGARRITRPIVALTAAARASRNGEKASYPTEGTVEIRELSRTLAESSKAQARMMRDLDSERSQLETIVKSAPCGLMLLDAEGKIICVNSVFSTLLRDASASAPGLRAEGELRSPELTRLISEARVSGTSQKNFTFRHEGIEAFYKARAIPVGDGELLVVIDDETERRRMDAARKTFVADAGHEFQTPLTTISAAAELLASMEDSTAEERAPYIDEIMRQRERMTMLVDDLLLLSRLESGIPTCEPEVFELAEMCRSLAKEAMQNSLSANIEWGVDLPDAGGVFFEGRPGEIKRALSNLLDNSVKYVRKRYEEASGGKISLSLRAGGENCVLTIADNGIGIPRDKLDVIFGRFERAEGDRYRDGRKNSGYGLGLAIAKHAVESHGGRIDASSSAGATVFTVTLPRTFAY